MKKTLLICLVLLAVMLVFAACGESDAPAPVPGEIQAPTTTKAPGVNGTPDTTKTPGVNGTPDTTKTLGVNGTPNTTEAPHVHSFGEWATTKDATCTEDGVKERTCACGEKETQGISASGHNYTTEVTPPTCTEKGYTTYTCHCGDSYVGDYTDAQHKDENNDMVCDVCGHTDLAPGLYDSQNNLIATWDELVNTYGMKVDVDYTINTYKTAKSSPYYVLTKTSALQNNKYGKKLVIGNVDRIGNYAFADCESLGSVIIPDSVTSIGECMFLYCSGLTNVVLPDSVTSIAYGAFTGCSTLEKITIPDSVTLIGDRAFYYCEGLESITIPNGVTSIEALAFWNCTSLENITIPNSVTYIGANVVAGCVELNKVIYQGAKEQWNQILGEGKEALDRFVQFEDVTAEPEEPASVVPGLYNANDQLIATWDELVNTYGMRIDVDRVAVIDLDNPDKSSPYYVLGKNKALTNGQKLVIGDSERIGEFAFYACSTLKCITISDSVTSIGKGAFDYCKSLTSILADENNPYYSSDGVALYSKDKTMLVQVPVGAASFVIPNGVTVIGDYAFSDFFSVKKTQNLVYLTIPEGVTSIGDHAFSGCLMLTSVTIPDTVTYIGVGAFAGCDVLMNFLVDENNPNYRSDVGDSYSVLYSKDNTVLLRFSGVVSSFVIPDGVTVIEDFAFYTYLGYESLTSITIPDSVTSIGNYAFYNCTGLTSIKIPDGVTSIGEYAFIGCDSLESITIPNSVTSIGEYAFRACNNLTSVTIPNSVTSIGNYAFSYCTCLKSITFNGSTAEWGAISKGSNWNKNVPATEVVCTDGTVKLK